MTSFWSVYRLLIYCKHLWKNKKLRKIISSSYIYLFKIIFFLWENVWQDISNIPSYNFRFISLLGYEKHPTVSGMRTEMWTTMHSFLARSKGVSLLINPIEVEVKAKTESILSSNNDQLYLLLRIPKIMLCCCVLYYLALVWMRLCVLVLKPKVYRIPG